MKTLSYLITLESDVIFSENSATTGGHTSLKYIPGASILGYCASKLYKKEKLKKHTFDLFHSGAVRFGNAYPLNEEKYPAIPIPLAWHIPKDKYINYCKDDKLNSELIFNSIHRSEIDSDQPKQIREGFFSEAGWYVLPKSNYRLKTAVDREAGGRAKEEQLFGYESLSAGSKWYFSIDIDDDVLPDDCIENINELFADTSFRIGRSRGAEYGLIKVQPMKNIDKIFNWKPQNISVNGVNYLIFYCLSDLALRDEITGTPIFEPKSSFFGETDIQYVPEKSFLRFRSYSPFNGKRKANDLERQVISMGSVITFKLENPISSDDLIKIQNRLNKGVGSYRQDGLGKVIVNPWFLSDEKFIPHEETASTRLYVKTATEQNQHYEDDLTKWLTRKSLERDLEIRIHEQVAKWAKVLSGAINQLGNKAPGKSQWSQLRNIALQCDSLENLIDKLFDEDGFRAAGVAKERWEEEFYFENKYISFREFLKEVVLKKFINDISEDFKSDILTKDENKAEKYRILIKKTIFMLGQQMPHELNQRSDNDK